MIVNANSIVEHIIQIKVDLNSFLAGKLLTHDFGDTILFISVNIGVKCYSTDINKEGIHIGCTQKEADTKIIVHVKHFLLNGNIVLKSVDSCVETLLTANLSLFDSHTK